MNHIAATTGQFPEVMPTFARHQGILRQTPNQVIKDGRRIGSMARKSRKKKIGDDAVVDPREVANFLIACGRTPSAVPKPVRHRKHPAAAKKSRIRNLAEMRWLAEVWADEERARQAKKSNVNIVRKV